MKRILSLIMAVLMIVTLFAACGNNAGDKTPNPSDSSKESTSADTAKQGKYTGSITASGSSALFPLVNYAADKFKSGNPDLSITINSGGSGTGLTQVSDGTVNIGNSDVYANEKLSADKASQLVDHKVSVVGVAITVNPDVAAKVSSLTKKQLKDIFTGKIANWKKVGGPDEAITIINRPASSGTRALFKQWALDGSNDLNGDAALTTDDSGALAETISKVKGSIGYLAFSYINNAGNKVKTLKLDGVAPTYDNIYDGSYPIWGYEHMYTKGEPKAAVKAFLDYMVSDELGKDFESMGYGVISKMKVSR